VFACTLVPASFYTSIGLTIEQTVFHEVSPFSTSKCPDPDPIQWVLLVLSPEVNADGV
jgi:hypothetical protein